MHWLDVPHYKLCATVHRCLQHKAPQYMTDCCIHTSDIARRQHLRSAGCHQLFVPAFHVRSSGVFCSRPGGLELVTRLPEIVVKYFSCNSAVFDFIVCNSDFDFILYCDLLLCFILLEMHVRLICAIKFYLFTYLLTYLPARSVKFL